MWIADLVSAARVASYAGDHSMTVTITTIDGREDLVLTLERVERLANDGIFDRDQADTMRATIEYYGHILAMDEMGLVYVRRPSLTQIGPEETGPLSGWPAPGAC